MKTPQKIGYNTHPLHKREHIPTRPLIAYSFLILNHPATSKHHHYDALKSPKARQILQKELQTGLQNQFYLNSENILKRKILVNNLEIVNEHTLLVKSPDSKTRQININDAKPVSATAATDNALQDFKLSAMKREHTHPYML